MVLIADGFYGGWHFAAGGWGGIKRLRKEPATEYEVYLGYEPEPVREIHKRKREDGTAYKVVVNVRYHGAKNTGRDWGQVYVGNGMTENDCYLHVLCPPAGWKKMQEAGGKVVEEEYAFLYYANWTAGGDIYRSVGD